MVIGTLAWEIAERLLALAGVTLELSVGPLAFDVMVLSISVMANPGTLIGIVPAVAIFVRA